MERLLQNEDSVPGRFAARTADEAQSRAASDEAAEITVPTEVDNLEAAVVKSIVRAATGLPTAEVSTWRCKALEYSAMNPTSGGLYRVAGSAHDVNQTVHWSVVLKVVRAPTAGASEGTKPSDWNYWKREPLAYESGLLDELSEGFAAPKCFRVDGRHNAVWLWLQHVDEASGPRWPLSRYALAATHFGRFNGMYLTERPLPTAEWLSAGDFLSKWLEHYGHGLIDIIGRPDTWQDPLVRHAFPQPVTDRLLRLWSEKDDLLSVLGQMQRSLCHRDGFRRNLLDHRARDGRRQTVAVDWATVGMGVLGEELVQLVGASLYFGEVHPAEARRLERIALDGYLYGLRETGWRGDAELIELGYAASCAIRWAIPSLQWLRGLQTRSFADFESASGRPIQQLVSHWAPVTYYFLDLADRARELANLSA